MSKDEHSKLGIFIAKSNIDLLLCVGDFAQNICSGALKAKMNKNKVFNFNSQKELFGYIENNVFDGDIILIKGSQGARMEKIVKALLKNKQDAKDLLVRQDEEWGD